MLLVHVIVSSALTVCFGRQESRGDCLSTHIQPQHDAGESKRERERERERYLERGTHEHINHQFGKKCSGNFASMSFQGAIVAQGVWLPPTVYKRTFAILPSNTLKLVYTYVE